MSVFRLEKTFPFEAAHLLPHHDGKCARLHGHSWKLTVIIQDHSLETEGPKSGMVMDYGDISRSVKPLLDEYLDHWYLNDSLDLESPTSEEIARWVFNYLKPSFGGRLVSISISETCTSACIYAEFHLA